MAFTPDEQVLENVYAHICVIEYQKQGFPRAHCIFFMTSISKVNLPNQTFSDKIMSAKIRSMQKFLLLQVVIKHNNHAPYGRLNPSAVCMLDIICSKQFSKDSAFETGHDEAKMCVTYRRRSPDNGGETAPWTYRTSERASITGTIDDSRVVPYCPTYRSCFDAIPTSSFAFLESTELSIS